MSNDAIIFAVITIAIIWGGLVFFLFKAISKESKKHTSE
ncbi:MAG: MetS family NSS transporter small subunit [Ignavibacteria bacterium]|nr:MetS family NSS transporter small subunit [Ignavibacteria bacterium]